MEITGKVHFVGQTESVGSNGFLKRLIVVETAEQYPQKLPIDFVQDKTNLLDNISVGQEISISVNARGNEYVDKNNVTRYGLSFQGWKIK